MLGSLRKATRGWIAAAVIALVALALVITLIPGTLPQPQDEIATGDGVKITVAEFDRELERRLDRARQSGQPATRAQVVEGGLHKALRDEMISERALDRLAQRLGLHVGDAVVGEEIRQIPSFKNQITGAFDKDTYTRLLAENGFTTTEFEDGLRRDIARRQLGSALTAGVTAPTAFTNFLISFETERRTVDIAEITLARVGQPPQPTEAQIEETYKAAAAQLATPEYRAVTLVLADAKAFISKVEVSPEDLRKQYEFAKNRFETPETRSFVQVTAPNVAAAREAARRLALGEDATAVAAAIGGTAAPFDGVERSAVPDPKVAAAVFSAAQGAATAAIDGELAWAAARVTSITPAVTKSFDEVQAELRTELASEEADGLVSAAVERYEDLVAGGTSLEDAAREAGLEVLVIPALDAQGRDTLQTPVPLAGDEKEFLEAIFATGEGEASEFTPLTAGPFALARIDKITPPGVRPLAEVRTTLINTWRARWVSQQFTKISDEVKAAVASGQTFAQATAAARIPLRQQGIEVDRRIAAQGPEGQVGRAIFAATEGEIVTAARPGAEPALLVVRVATVSRPDPSGAPAELRLQAAEAARQQMQQDFVQTLSNAARSAAKVKVNDAALDRLLGVTPSASDDPAS